MPSGKQERMECHCTAGVALGWGWLEEDVVGVRPRVFLQFSQDKSRRSHRLRATIGREVQMVPEGGDSMK